MILIIISIEMFTFKKRETCHLSLSLHRIESVSVSVGPVDFLSASQNIDYALHLSGVMYTYRHTQ